MANGDLGAMLKNRRPSPKPRRLAGLFPLPEGEGGGEAFSLWEKVAAASFRRRRMRA